MHIPHTSELSYSVSMSFVRNKKAHLEYTLEETLEAGIELLGTEAKSLRAGNGKLEGARVVVRGGEAYLIGANIPAWQPKNAGETYDAERARRLLLNAKELAHLSAVEGAKGLTIVPISVYNKGRNLKLEIAVARGKKKYDKREDIKKRDEERRMRRREI